MMLALLAAGVDPGLVVAALAMLVGGSGIAGWLTVRNTNKTLAVKASTDAVDAVDKALNRLEVELNRALEEQARLRSQLESTREEAAEERGRLQLRIDQLQERVVYLEDVVERYRRRAEDHGLDPEPYDGPERRDKP